MKRRAGVYKPGANHGYQQQKQKTPQNIKSESGCDHMTHSPIRQADFFVTLQNSVCWLFLHVHFLQAGLHSVHVMQKPAKHLN
jgi:hypothetical protein